MADATIEVEAKLIDQMSGGLKAIQHEMARLEKTTFDSTKGIKQELDALKKKAEDQKGAFSSATLSVAKWAAGITAGIVASRAMLGVMSSSISEAIAAREAQADLAATLASTGHAAGMTQEELNKLADSLSAVTNFEDDAITKSQAMLLTFTKIGKDVFPEATEATLNMAQKFKTDASQAAIQLGKALNDPIGGVTALRRVGVMLTEQQEAQIKAMVKAGDVAAAQRVILAELATEFGGLARASADPLKQFQNRISNVKEDIGNALLPALDSAAASIGKIIEEGNKTGELQSAFSVIADTANLAASAISGVTKAMASLNEMEVRSGGVGTESIENTKALKSSLEEVKRLREEMTKTQVTDGESAAKVQDLIRQHAAARAEVERIAGTVAAPGILASLEKNISALEHRIQKLQKEPAKELSRPTTTTGARVQALTDEQIKAIEEARKFDEQAKTNALKREADFQNKVRQAAEREQKEARDAAVAEDEKRTEAIYKARQQLAEAQGGTDEMAVLKAKQSAELEAIAGNETAITTLKQAHALQRDALSEEMAEKEKKREKEVAEAKAQAVAGLFGGLANLQRQANMHDRESRLRFKALAIAEATVNTYLAATKALASAPPPFNYIAMAGVIATGLAQVGQIKDQKFASGTLSAPGGMALVGERGPELVELPRGARVYNNSESRGMMGGGGITHTGNVVLQIAMPPGATPAQAEAMGSAAGRGYQDYLKTLKRDIRNIDYMNIPDA